MYLIKNGHKEVVKILLSGGAQANLPNQDRQTSLMLASENGHEEIVSILLSAGAQVNLQDYITLSDLDEFRKAFCQHYSLCQVVLMLRSMRFGSVAVVWLIPSCAVEYLCAEMKNPDKVLLTQYSVLEVLINGMSVFVSASVQDRKEKVHEEESNDGENMFLSRDPIPTDELLDCACKQRFDEKSFTPFLKENCHFWVAINKQIARFGLSFDNSKADEYSYLENLTPELFSSMVEVLLHFQQQPRAGTSHEENKASILNYHFGWKTQVPFHLKILPHSLEDYRSTIFHYVPDAPNMSDPSIYTEYEVYESKLKFIKENISDGDAFHALDDTCDDGRKCTFYISRGTYSIVAANSIDMSGCEHPYCEAYHYARMLETRFKKDVVGGVSLAVDHSGKKMWVWADCDEAAFEGAVLIPHKVEKKAAFQPYIAHLQHKPDGCKAVLVINRLDSRIQKEYLEQFFNIGHKCFSDRIRCWGVDNLEIHFKIAITFVTIQLKPYLIIWNSSIMPGTSVHPSNRMSAFSTPALRKHLKLMNMVIACASNEFQEWCSRWMHEPLSKAV
ncbi:hypothetical protein EMCRGX_G000804 [Ephydatia muelleri]